MSTIPVIHVHKKYKLPDDNEVPKLTILKTQAQDIWEQLFQSQKPKEYSDTSEYHPSYTLHVHMKYELLHDD